MSGLVSKTVGGSKNEDRGVMNIRLLHGKKVILLLLLLKNLTFHMAMLLFVSLLL